MSNKQIVFKVTKAHMLKNKKRTLITYFGILVMVMLMTAVFVGKDTVITFMKDAVAADKGKWHVQVYDVNKKQADEICALEEVDKAEISRAIGYTDFAQSGNREVTPFLEIKAYSDDLFDWMNIEITEGRLPENENEIIISERAIEEGADISIGDQIEVETFDRYIHAFFKGDEKAGDDVGSIMFTNGIRVVHGDTVKAPEHFTYYETNEDFEMIHEPTGFNATVTVVGIMETPYYETAGQGGYMALMMGDDICEADETVNLVLTLDEDSKADYYGDILRITLEDKTPEEIEELIAEGTIYVADDGEHLPLQKDKVVTNDMLLTLSEKGSDGNFNFMVAFAETFFIVLIVAASLILIYNVFSISYRERSVYLGLLSSVGATRAQKKWSVYYEVFVLLLLALPLGIILGIAGVKIAMVFLYPNFAQIIGSISRNVITGKSCEIGYKIIVNPSNILFVAVSSTLAMWISAWLPALKISKIGPIESIRGTADIGRKSPKGVKTAFKLMQKGKAEKLLASKSISRNKHSTSGIVRSITAFVALTLITAFAVNSLSDVLSSKTDNEDIELGSSYTEYDYYFDTDVKDDYQKAKTDIMSSDEIAGYKELRYDFFSGQVALDCYTDEYRDSLKNILSKYFPDELPQFVYDLYLNPVNAEANPAINYITLTRDEFDEIAENAGIDTEGLANPVLVYDRVKLTTDDFKIAFNGAQIPDYTAYSIEKPLKVKAGDTMELLYSSYNGETEEWDTMEYPISFAGYVDADDIKDFYVVNGEQIWMLFPEDTAEGYESAVTDAMGGLPGIEGNIIFFSTNTDDANILRRLGQFKTEFGDSCIGSADLLTGMTDLLGALTTIVNIIAVCFTVLIAVICLLNLYNSVMGRRLARHHELSVLASLGFTNKQKRKMLLTENVILLGKSLLFAGLITVVFVICLQMLLNNFFGKIDFTYPVWIVLLTVFISIAGLFGFTYICYGDSDKGYIIEDVKSENI
ncbi:MAG: ABC transporter permease [Clostridia bacterium]|nr:ABC transporter permease [Clostridia bacterium]